MVAACEAPRAIRRDEREPARTRRRRQRVGDLVRCYWAPSQVDTCTPELLREAKRWADETRRPYTVHTSQSVVEFNEMLARHGVTPVAWLHERRLRPRRRRKLGLCPACGYDLRESPGRCPECGRGRDDTVKG